MEGRFYLGRIPFLTFRYSDFCEMVCPIDSDYYNMIKSREDKQLYSKNTHSLSIDTKILFSRLVKKIIELEYKAEEWRVELDTNTQFAIRDTFNRIDIMRRTYLTKEDVSF